MSKFLETNGFIGMIGEVDVKKDLVKSLEKIKHRAWKQITIINNKEILNIEDYLEEPNSKIAIGCCITSNNEQHTKNNIAIHGMQPICHPAYTISACRQVQWLRARKHYLLNRG